jgi:hypothetical protein
MFNRLCKLILIGAVVITLSAPQAPLKEATAQGTHYHTYRYRPLTLGIA